MRRLFVLALILAISHMPFTMSALHAKETDAEVPLAGISASLQPDLFTGTLTGSIPIEVAPGRNGMQPNLALSYASSGGNGWLGMGWKLEMGTIERQTRWGVLYSPTPAEEQAGKVYTFRLNGVSTDLVQDATDPLLYHEKIKSSFLRIKKLASDGTAGWEVTDTKGTKYRFGTGATTRIQGTVGTLGMQIFKWCLERVEDRDGNYMTITYTGDQGQGYLSQIDYAGNGATAPTNQVKFYLEDRTDAPDMYTSNFKIKTAKRLKTIEVKGNGVLVRAYRLCYLGSPSPCPTTSGTSLSSLLASVQQFGKDATVDPTGTLTAGTALPASTLTYHGGGNGLNDPVNWNSYSKLGNFGGTDQPRWSDSQGDRSSLVDMNGDGRLDYVALVFNGQHGLWVLLNNGSGFNDPVNWNSYSKLGSGGGTDQPRWSDTQGDRTSLIDMNGDGRPDYVSFHNYAGGQHGLWVLLNNGSGFNDPVNWNSYSKLGSGGGTDQPRWSDTQGDRTSLIDMNGDGRPDYVSFHNYATGQHGLWVLLNNGSGFNDPVNWNSFALLGNFGGSDQPRWSDTGGDRTNLIDMNGDGRPDYVASVFNGQHGLWVLLNNGSGFNDPVNWNSYSKLGSGGGTDQPRWSDSQGDRTSLIDMNGDGRPDYVSFHNYATGQHGLWVLLNNGSGFNDPVNWNSFSKLGSGGGTDQPRWSDTQGDRTSLIDMNGDGRPDYVSFHNYAGGQHGLWVLLNNGSGFNDPVSWNSFSKLGNFGGTDQPRWWLDTVGDRTTLVDINGDGRLDYVALVFNGQHGLWVLTNSGSAPNLLSTISTGLGGATTVTYTPSPQHSTTSTPAHPQLPYPVQTVTSLTTTDGNGNSATTNYKYYGGYHHLGERDFRGFQKVEVTSPGATDAEKTLTTTEFLQGRGVLSGGITTLAADDPSVTGDASLEGHPYRVTVAMLTAPTFIYTKTETMYHDDRIGTNTTAPYFTPPAQVDSSICDGGTCTTMRVSYAATDYDIYGNLTRENNHGNLAVTGDENTIQRAYLANTTDYIVSVPVRETVYKNLSVAAGDKLAETLFYYDGTGTGACTAAPTGSATTVTKGHVTKTERWLSGGINPISGMEYDPITGVLLCTLDPRGNKTTLAHDSTKTFVLTTTNQLGHVNTAVISGVNGEPIDPATGFYGQVKSMTDPNGKIVTHEYDALGRKTKTTAPDGQVTTVTYPTLAEYGQIGTQKITTSTSGASLPAPLTSSTFFDGLGRTITKESSGPNGTTLVAKTEYTVKGQVSRTSLPYFKTTESTTGRWRTMSYDPLGRVMQITHPDTLSGTALTTKTCYAPFVTVSLDPSGARKREVQDAYGRVVTIHEYNSTTTTCDTAVGSPYATTNYTYDLLGNLTKVVDHLGNRTTMRYDTLSRKIAMADPDMSTNGTTNCGDLTAMTPAGTYPWYNAPCWIYQYDAAGNLERQRDAKSQTLWFRYDGLNRRSQKDYTTQKAQGSGDVVYVYDDTVTTFNRKGRLKQVTDVSGNVTFEYDSRGRISKSSKVLDGTTYVTTSLYDGVGRLKDVTYPSTPAKTVEYLYTGPVLDKVQDKAGSGTTIYATYTNYTSQGQPGTITYGNGVVTTSTYADPAHATCIPANSFKLCTLKTQKGTNPLAQDMTYTFTADGNVDLITDPLNGNQDFVYDTLDRLTSATGPYGSGGATATLTYTYNQIGNLTNNSQVGAYTYPTSQATSVRPHAVTTAGANSYTYDNNGNLTSGAGRTYTWNLENKPLTVVQGGTTTTFVYDGEGGRVKKIVGTTTTRYISTLYECDNTNCTRFIWAGSTRVATIAASGTIHYWHGDHLGSSSVITDSTGAKVQALAYYPYGATRTNVPGTPVNVPYKYTGKELDNTGLYYYEARYYDPTLGRFISADTIVPNPRDPQDLNRYTYASNNPLRYTDPTGHFSLNIGKALRRALGDVGVAVLGTALQFAGPFGQVTNFVLGAGVLTQSKTGRYVLAGEIVGATAAGAVACTVSTAGACAGATPFLVGAAIGASSGAAMGGYSAARNGGDLSSGILFGAAVGATTGAITGYVGGQLPGLNLAMFLTAPGQFLANLGALTGAGMVLGAVQSASTGAITAYAGGKGQIGDILSSAGENALDSFSPEGAALTAAGVAWGARPRTKIFDSLSFEIGGWESGPISIPTGVQNFVNNEKHILRQVGEGIYRAHSESLAPGFYNYAHFTKEFAPQ